MDIDQKKTSNQAQEKNHIHTHTKKTAAIKRVTYVGFEDIGGVLDVGDVVAELLDGVDQTPDVSCTIVEQVCSCHFFSFRLLLVGWLVG